MTGQIKTRYDAAQENLSRAAQAMIEATKTAKTEGRALTVDEDSKFRSASDDSTRYGKECSELRSTWEALQAADAASSALTEPATPRTNVSAARVNAGDRPVAGLLRGRNHFRPGANPTGLDPETHGAMTDLYVRQGYEAVARQYGRELAAMPATVRQNIMSTTGSGGFIVKQQRMTELLQDVAATSAMLRICRIIPATTGKVEWPTLISSATPRKYKSGFTGEWRIEGEMEAASAAGTSGTQDQPQYGSKEIPVHTWSPDEMPFTLEQIEDSAFDVEGVAFSIGAETAALEWENEFINGNGSRTPRGILDAAQGIGTVSSSASADVSYAGFTNLIYGSSGVATQWRAGMRLLLHSQTYANTLLLDDGAGRPLVSVFTSPDSLHGAYPFEFSEWMPVPASSAKVVVAGNFANYGIAMRSDVRLLRLTERYAPGIGLKLHARIGGDVLRPNAFKIMTCGA